MPQRKQKKKNICLIFIWQHIIAPARHTRPESATEALSSVGASPPRLRPFTPSRRCYPRYLSFPFRSLFSCFSLEPVLGVGPRETANISVGVRWCGSGTGSGAGGGAPRGVRYPDFRQTFRGFGRQPQRQRGRDAPSAQSAQAAQESVRADA